jgi:hypothetical protein
MGFAKYLACLLITVKMEIDLTIFEGVITLFLQNVGMDNTFNTLNGNSSILCILTYNHM